MAWVHLARRSNGLVMIGIVQCATMLGLVAVILARLAGHETLTLLLAAYVVTGISVVVILAVIRWRDSAAKGLSDLDC